MRAVHFRRVIGPGSFTSAALATARRWRLARHLALALLALPSAAFAWGPAGHRMVAALAEAQLHASARREVLHLLAVSADISLADVANWADDIRDDPLGSALARQTTRMHFINFPDSGCHYDAARICAGGQCVVAAIDAYAAALGDRTRPDQERAQALRFLVHFVGDVHQPLHAGYRPDRGGNNYQVRIDGKGSNLHSIWDSRILGSRRLGWKDYARRLERQPIADDDENPIDWAEQSCRVVRDDGVYPGSRTIDKAYLARMRPLAELQIRRAGARLATLLNRELD
jgi:hypothetical protein